MSASDDRETRGPAAPRPPARGAIAFCADRQILPGLHVALLSLLDSLEPTVTDAVTIFIFADRLSRQEKQALRATYSTNPGGVELVIRDFVPRALKGGNSLHGNSTTYGRLYLASLLNDYDRCVYLDCDLVVHTSVLGLFDYFDGRHVLFAFPSLPRNMTNDTALFIEAGLGLEGRSFNAGVLAIDLELWRRRDVSTQLAAAARRYSDVNRSSDQGLLNVVLHDTTGTIDETYNTRLHPTLPAVRAVEARIYHFITLPKPWDPFGRQLHGNYQLWKTVFDRTALAGKPTWRYGSLRRGLALGRCVFDRWRTGRRPRT